MNTVFTVGGRWEAEWDGLTKLAGECCVGTITVGYRPCSDSPILVPGRIVRVNDHYEFIPDDEDELRQALEDT